MEHAIDYTWLRDSAAVAASTPRGTSSPGSRRDHLAREYERALSSVAAPAPLAMSNPPRRIATTDREGASFPWSDYNGDGTQEPFGRFEQAAYGAGRELEKAIQVARFDRVTGNNGRDWVTGLRK